MIFEIVRITPQGDKFYLAPESAQNAGKWLIEVDTMAEAEKLRGGIGMGRFPTPVADPSKYKKIGDVGNTPLYRVK